MDPPWKLPCFVADHAKMVRTWHFHHSVGFFVGDISSFPWHSQKTWHCTSHWHRCPATHHKLRPSPTITHRSPLEAPLERVFSGCPSDRPQPNSGSMWCFYPQLIWCIHLSGFNYKILHIWRFPTMGDPQIIKFIWFFLHKPSIWGSPIYGNHQIFTNFINHCRNGFATGIATEALSFLKWCRHGSSDLNIIVLICKLQMGTDQNQSYHIFIWCCFFLMLQCGTNLFRRWF